MKLSLLLSHTVAVYMVSLFPTGLGLCIYPDRVIANGGDLPEERKPVGAESMAAEWSSTISLHNPQSWLRVRMAVVPEGRKQWSVDTERMAAKWSSTIGLHNPQSWVRVRMAVVPEGRKQQPIGTESMASDLPYPLGQLWDKLAQEDMAWLLCRACQTVWLLCMAWIVVGLWRNVKRPQAQVSNGDQSHRKGPGCGEQGTATALARKACNEKTKPSAGKKASAGPERSSASFPGTRQAAGLKPSGSPQHNMGPGGGFLSPTCCREQSCEAGGLPEEAKPSRTLVRHPSSRLLHCASCTVISREGDGRPRLPWGQTASNSASSANTTC